MEDIKTRKDIVILIDHFYEKVKKDELIGPIFNEKLGSDWLRHLDKIYAFWSTILINERSYFGSPFMAHVNLGLQEEHFKRWLKLFETSIDALFKGEKAENAKMRAFKMAEMFQIKLKYYDDNESLPLI